MEKIKLIVSDIDGTLVDKTERIPEELIQKVKECRQAGIAFALATGRTKELTDPFVQALGVEVPCVEANGAYIVQGDHCLVEHGFPIAAIRDILLQANDMGLTVTLADTAQERAMRDTEYVRYHRSLGDRFRKLLPPESIHWERDRFHKVMVYDEERSGKIESIRSLLQPFSDAYWITTYSDKAVELGPRGCNKATGVKELASILGLGVDQVMACGDYKNDLEMISGAGWGVAVGNAHPDVKAAAGYTATKEYAYGVIEAIDALCFGKK